MCVGDKAQVITAFCVSGVTTMAIVVKQDLVEKQKQQTKVCHDSSHTGDTCNQTSFPIKFEQSEAAPMPGEWVAPNIQMRRALQPLRTIRFHTLLVLAARLARQL